ncbi:hypothetical protein [Leptospira borgpetersenii]|uniref:hypothetical protein n=2 Tax=Leptospira borgpetersenii TaxID=174 RepID=UPI00187EEEB8|nr:hypothetical protein [Leptospira borgpetersenii]MBE8364012.1 hypothetical protein [Leptospira borgpetersenii serovar Balcanica]MBE8368896.1 hypothetical protein [Leptospira borgpetersenii serovar Balcanica]MBE8423104.1 hypothetical protein [Leptospira borgpetersenii serovar Balcanica]MBF3350185.1 hypothetical protein [Leptospira borgpetersenii serovar Balcanica]
MVKSYRWIRNFCVFASVYFLSTSLLTADQYSSFDYLVGGGEGQMKSQLDAEAAKVASFRLLTSGSDPVNSYLAYRYLSRPTNTTFQISEQTFVYESAHIITWGISISQTKIQRNGTAYEPNSDVERFYYNARLMGLQLTDYASQINQKVTVVDGLITELKLGIRGSNSLYSNRNESGTFPNLYLTAGGGSGIGRFGINFGWRFQSGATYIHFLCFSRYYTGEIVGFDYGGKIGVGADF